jgi:hypothetical protein
MTRKEPSPKQKKHRKIGIEAIIEPGVGALYVRGTWIKRLDELKRKKKLIRQFTRKKIRS